MTPRKMALALAVAAGQSQQQVAKELGYADSTSAAIGRVLKEPKVAAIVRGVQETLREQAVYHLQDAIDECDSISAFARAKGNPMALVKAHELRTKLLGFHKERLEIQTISIGLAISDAKERVATRLVNPVPLPAPPVVHQAKDRNADDLFGD